MNEGRGRRTWRETMMRMVAVKEFEVPLLGLKVPAFEDETGRQGASIDWICDSLGLDLPQQVQMLRRSGWATVWKVVAPDEFGETYPQWCLSIHCLRMWMIQIPPSQVRPEFRPILARLRGEATGVLHGDVDARRNFDKLFGAGSLDGMA